MEPQRERWSDERRQRKRSAQNLHQEFLLHSPSLGQKSSGGGYCPYEHLSSKTPTMTLGLLAALSTLCLYRSEAASEPSSSFSASHCAMTLCMHAPVPCPQFPVQFPVSSLLSPFPVQVPCPSFPQFAASSLSQVSCPQLAAPFPPRPLEVFSPLVLTFGSKNPSHWGLSSCS